MKEGEIFGVFLPILELNYNGSLKIQQVISPRCSDGPWLKTFDPARVELGHLFWCLGRV